MRRLPGEGGGEGGEGGGEGGWNWSHRQDRRNILVSYDPQISVNCFQVVFFKKKISVFRTENVIKIRIDLNI